jgi:hypothetical protein
MAGAGASDADADAEAGERTRAREDESLLPNDRAEFLKLSKLMTTQQASASAFVAERKSPEEALLGWQKGWQDRYDWKPEYADSPSDLLRRHTITSFLRPQGARTRKEELGAFETFAQSRYPLLRSTSLMLFYDGTADEYGVLMCEHSGLIRWSPRLGKTTVYESSRVDRLLSVWSSTSCLVIRNYEYCYIDLEDGAVTKMPNLAADHDEHDAQPVLISKRVVIDYVNPSRFSHRAGFLRWSSETPKRLEWLLYVVPGAERSALVMDIRALSDHSVMLFEPRASKQHIVQFDGDGRNPVLLRSFTFACPDHGMVYRPNLNDIVCCTVATNAIRIHSMAHGYHAQLAGSVADVLHNVVLFRDTNFGLITYSMALMRTGARVADAPPLGGARRKRATRRSRKSRRSRRSRKSRKSRKSRRSRRSRR